MKIIIVFLVILLLAIFMAMVERGGCNFLIREVPKCLKWIKKNV